MSEVIDTIPQSKLRNPLFNAIWSLDSSGNPVGIYGADGQTWLVISADAPSDGDGRPNGTIYIQTA